MVSLAEARESVFWGLVVLVRGECLGYVFDVVLMRVQALVLMLLFDLFLLLGVAEAVSFASFLI